jgi:D-alanyl-D-alanine dipeptidase
MLIFSQIDRVLPKSSWEKVKIEENKQKMVIPHGGNLILDKENRYSIRQSENRFRVRQMVANKLHDASMCLPKGLKLVLIEGYRSLIAQRNVWEMEYERLIKVYPKLPTEEIERRVGLVIARPNPLANHNCGGAVDVTFEDENGNQLDMGTPPQSVDAELSKMFSHSITSEQSDNRKILRTAMKTAGFVYYPGEWWHYCYGDRMWAVYTKRTECFYGPVTNDFYK